MAAWQSPRTPDEVFLLSEASGFRSRGTVKLKAGSAYQAGSVLQAEVAAPSGGGAAVATGFHVLADGSGPAAVVLCRFNDATDGTVEAAVIDADAEVKRGELTFVAGATAPVIAAVIADLAANGIKVR